MSFRFQALSIVIGNNMKIFFRVDSSINIGSGHLMRCLTLADYLHNKGAQISFICRNLPGNFCSLIGKKGYFLYRLPYTKREERSKTDVGATKDILLKGNGGIDCLIVDQYYLSQKWESQIRPYVKRIMVIDDLANRSHDCDILLDQNYYSNMDHRYDGLIPPHCRRFLGPRYALLREEFFVARKNLRQRDGIVRRIFISFGASDTANETEKALEAARMLNRPDISVDVVVGRFNPNKEKIKQLCRKMPNANFYRQTENMAKLMHNADLAIGAAGTMTWERCFLGLPSIVVTIATNQVGIAFNLAKAGAVSNLGFCANVKISDILRALKRAIDNPKVTRKMAHSAINLAGDVSIGYREVLLDAIMNKAYLN